MNTRILAALVGVAPNLHVDFCTAPQSRQIVPMVLILVAIRLRRRLGRLFVRLREKSTHRASRAKTRAKTSTDVAATDTAHAADDASQAGASPHTTVSSDFPRLVFQTWKSRYAIPANYARWSESFKRLNPDFDYYLWDDSQNRCFIEKYYPWFLPTYDTYPREIYRVDAVRYFFLYQFGGIYADMDTECLRPLAPLFRSGDVWLGRMGNDADFPHSRPNAIMASRPRQEFWLLAIHLLVEKAKALGDPAAMAGKGPEVMTGPFLLKNAYDLYTGSEPETVRSLIHGIAAQLPESLQPRARPSQITLLAPDLWYPIDWSNMIHLRLSTEVVDHQLQLGARTKHWLFPRAYLVTYWTHSWKQPGSQSQPAAA